MLDALELHEHRQVGVAIENYSTEVFNNFIEI
jgi:hypothetical protein